MLDNIQHIRESGLLELYVIGELSPGEVSKVEAALELFPELKTDLNQIEKALHTYAEAQAIQAPQHVLNELLNKTQADTKSNSTGETAKSKDSISGLTKALALALVALLGTSIYQIFNNKSLTESHSNEITKTIENCNEEKQALIQKLNLYKELEKVDNRSINVAPTDKYPDTKIIFNTNEVTKRNFLQFKFLPELAPNQSYQLWSLKGDSDPIPLNVFEDISELLEVDFVEGTNAYAITIEPKGGQDSPTLENLIGVFSIAG